VGCSLLAYVRLKDEILFPYFGFYFLFFIVLASTFYQHCIETSSMRVLKAVSLRPLVFPRFRHEAISVAVLEFGLACANSPV
jgi:hypothetical protein